ncbi:hypothetical protein D3C73_919680 [compost metagenome]
MLAGGSGLAARVAALAGLPTGPVFGAGTVPGVCHRHEPWRAENERHHAGHRPRHAPGGGGALHLPAPVPRRADGAAVRCRGFCRADADQDPGHSRPRGDRQHRRGSVDLHQPDPAAGVALLCRRDTARGATEPEERTGRTKRSDAPCLLAFSRPVHPSSLGQPVHRHQPGAGGARFCGQPATENRRPRRRCAGAACGLALQPGRCLPDPSLRRQQRPVRGDGENPGQQLCAL